MHKQQPAKEQRLFMRLFWIALALGVVYFFYTSWYVWGPLRENRLAVLRLLGAASEYQQGLNPRLINGENIAAQSLPIKDQENLSHLFVNEHGEIIAISTKIDSFVILSPVIENNVVSWHCLGSPAEYFPSYCRAD